jgi:hypothetical protein
MYSGYPDNCKTHDEQEAYVKQVNDGMGWTGDAQLKGKDIEDNVALRNFYKLLMKALLGKFGQDLSTKKSTVTVSSQKELDELFWKEGTKVCDWISMSPYVVEVSTEAEKGYNKPNVNGNCIISAHVTAYARIEMDKAIRKLLDAGISVLYTDTDSIIFSIRKGQQIPLVEGPCFHQFKNEIPDGEILSFYTLGPKIYQITYRNIETNLVKTSTKVKGFFLQSKKGKEIIHDNIFSDYVSSFLQGEQMSSKVGQFQIKTSEKRRLKSIISQKMLTNFGFNKRVAFRGVINSRQTLPYGYTNLMYESEVLNNVNC